jgi:hypothetical protein
VTEQAIHLICAAECGIVSEDDAEGWRAYTASGLEGDEDPDPFVVSFCPQCARRELGPSRRSR